VGRTLTWSSRTESNTSAQQVLVTVREGQTLIRIEESFGGLAGGLFGGRLETDGPGALPSTPRAEDASDRRPS